ncbi:MAG TPA: hypothetical protein PKI19_08295 [Elusimicrobiales bacterium]|nr:hypothetical protein [Elusimicrobiales bacterium]
MKNLALAALCLVFFSACRQAPAASRFEPGDYAVYKYYGAYRPQPVFLTNKVLSKKGAAVEMLVEWRSGAERRAWKEFFTDTPYNRANNLVDRLVSLEGGKEKELANAENLDLFKLYEGTYLMAQHAPRPESEAEKTVQVGSEKFSCRVRVYDSKALNARLKAADTDCADFKWGKVSSYWAAVRGGALLYAFEIQDHGSLKPAAAGK